jgi:hypothetical protein
MSKIRFNLLQLIVENISSGERFSIPSVDSFDELEETFHTLIDDVYYEVIVEKDDDYIWFAFDYGKPDPIDDKLTNVKTGVKKNNLRKNDEAELLHQLFALYDFNKNLLYLSNLNKEKIFEKMLQEKLQKPFITKKFFKPKDEFIEILKEVDEISFTETRDLFSQDSKKRQALIDLTGTDAPEKFTLNAKYSKNTNIINFIKELIKSKGDAELNELVIKGIDNDNFGFVFNVDSFVQRISFSSKKNDKGKFDAELIKQELLKRLSNER